MKLFSKYINYFFTGVGFGASCYLCALAFIYPGVAPTIKSVVSVLFISGLIGIMSMVFERDLSLTVTLIIHLIGTFLLFLVMVIINNWTVNWKSIFVFIFFYLIIWIILVLEQKNAINKMNIKINQRNSYKK